MIKLMILMRTEKEPENVISHFGEEATEAWLRWFGRLLIE